MTFLVQTYINVLEKQEDKTLPGLGYVVKFYDHDALKDDLLAEAVPDDAGKVCAQVKVKNSVKTGSLHERIPVLYFTVLRNGKEIYKSDVYKNIRWQMLKNGSFETVLVFDLGTIVV
ncbi:MAG: hypothetical protein HYZ14_04750 [Bacteroidetes bacterium]|nr:hypothetical protein [Bacteroidota bacterium]